MSPKKFYMYGCALLYVTHITMRTAALDATAAELLQFVAANYTREGQQPRSVHTNCAYVVKGMKTALSEMGISVRYYPPPSSEEMAATQSR